MSAEPETSLKHYLQLKFQKPYTPERIVSLVTAGVVYLARLRTLEGPEKKALLLKVVREIIEGSELEDYRKDMLLDIIDTVGDSMIESLVLLGKDMVAFAKSNCRCWSRKN